MKKIQYFSGIIASIAVVIILLISSFEIAMYSDFDYYQEEYTKYDVLSDLNMEMEDIMYVTEEMMAYLRGERETLSVVTMVDGREQDFFNGQDRFHMWEVQKLFTGGLTLRRGAVSILINCLLIMALSLEKERKNIVQNLKVIMCRSYQIVMGILAVAVGLTGIAVMRDFDKVFTLFHKIFFDNDLWIFDPAEDYMIRMLPQGLFYDFVIRIGGLFIGMLVGVLIISIYLNKKMIKIKKVKKIC
ncbi:MAG: TIGR01906 family membrane protein [Schaedlerella sp.]|nr:TIGR01906 family membrane protein [Schaedlerella sp.]